MSKNDPPRVVDQPPQPTDIANLQESFNKQQAKISALKELVRQSELAHGKSTTTTQEKVKNINERLTKMKYKARSRQSLDESFSDSLPIEESPNVSIIAGSVATPPTQLLRTRSETPGSEKFQLLRKQMEQNKLKMVERENSKREIEELVTQLKAKFDSTQQSLEHSSEIGRSMGDLSVLSYTPVRDKIKSATDLTTAPLNLDKERIKYLDNRIRLLEKQLEKERNQHQSKDETDSDQLISQLQSKIAKLEKSLKDMASSSDSEEKKDESKELKDLDKLNKQLQDRINKLEAKIKNDEQLEAENQMQKDEIERDQSLLETESQKFEMVSKDDLNDNNDIAQQINEEYIVQIQALNEKIQELENENDALKKITQESQDIQVSDENVAEVIKTLEMTIEAQKEEIQKQSAAVQIIEEKLAEKTIEFNVLNANFSVLQEKLHASAPKSLFSQSSDEESELIINKLKAQLDEANKSMIKIKLNSKKLQKQIDTFKKSSDSNAALVKAMTDNQRLQQRITDLENEIQLLQFNVVSTSDVMSEDQIEKKLHILETTCQNQNSAIQLLEEQKLDMTEHLQSAKSELESLKDQFHEINKDNTARVASEMESIQLEEQVNVNRTQINELSKENNNLKEELSHLKNEKLELTKKVDHYIAENMELLDKIEKLSKSSSSAESIEIVESLTHQERQEIEEFNRSLEHEHATEETTIKKKLVQSEAANSGAIGQELSESLVQLREESSELMHKIELFTTERREVLEKMEKLSAENQENLKTIEKLTAEKEAAENNLSQIQSTQNALEEKCETLNQHKMKLVRQMDEFLESKDETNMRIKVLTEQLEKSATFITPTDVEGMIDKCEKCLSKLNIEIENYRKANERNKINVSRKLAKEAKNIHQQVSEFLEKLKSVQTGKCDDLEKTISSLQMELGENRIANEELFAACQKKSDEVNILQGRIDILEKQCETFDKQKQERNDEASMRLKKDFEHKIESSEAEIKILKELIEEQKRQIIDSYTEREEEMRIKLDELKQKDQQINELQRQLRKMTNDNKNTNEDYILKLQNEIDLLKETLNTNKSLMVAQADELKNKQKTIDSLNDQIMDLYKTMEENANKVIEKDDELLYLQELLDTNKVKLDRLQKEADDQKALAQKLLIELHSHKDNSDADRIQFLENRIAELEKARTDADSKSKDQLEKLKKYAANLKKKVIQCSEYEKKIREIEVKLNQTSTLELETKLKTLEELHQKELRRHQDQMGNLRSENELLFNERQAAEEHLKKALSELETFKTQNLSTETVEKFELEISEKNQLLNTLKHQFGLVTIELENSQKLFENMQEQAKKSEKFESELKEREALIETLTDNLKAKTIKFEKCKAILKEKNREIQRLTKEKEEISQRIKDTQSEEITVAPNTSTVISFEKELKELQEQYLLLQERNQTEKLGFQDTVSRLETLHDGIQAKLQEDMSYIESLEIENNNFKDKICRLEECVASFEERRTSMERRANLLDAQLHNKTKEFEKSEDALVYRLNMLSEHDDIIGQRLLQTQEEKEELSDKLDRLRSEHSELLVEFTKLEKELTTLQTDTNNSLETENQSLREQLANHEKDFNKIHANHNAALAKKNAEIDELENDLSEQLNLIETQKRNLQEQLERATDEVKALNDELVKQKESLTAVEQVKNELEREITWIKMQNENLCQDQFELHELRMQTMQDKNELENLKHQYDSLLQNHDFELNALRLQISELDHLRSQVGQNQTDDQVFVQTENVRLKNLLAEKEATIESYQRQNLQLQMSSMIMGATSTSASTPTIVDPFLSLGSTSQPDDTYENNQLKEKCEKLEKDLLELQSLLKDKNEEILNMQTTHAAILESKPDDTIEMEALNEKSLKLEKEIAELKQTSSEKINETLKDLNDLQLQYASAKQSNSEMEKLLAELKLTLSEKNEQISKLTDDLSYNLHQSINSEKERNNKISKLERELSEVHSKLKLKIDENFQISNDFNNLQIEFKRIEDADPFSAIGMSTTNDKCERLENELAELHTALHNRNQQYETLSNYYEALKNQSKEQESNFQNSQIQCQQITSDLQNLQFEFNELLIGNAEMQKQNLSLQTELASLKVELENCKSQNTAAINATSPSLNTTPVASVGSAASFFDEIITQKTIEKLAAPVPLAHPNEQKMNDLQLTVQNLQMNSIELENNLRDLTIDHENTLRQLRENKIMYENNIKMYEQKLKVLEDKTKEFEIQKSLESQIISVPSLNMFFSESPASGVHFEPTQMSIQQSFEVPVVEDIIVPKKSYVCQPDTGPTQTTLDFGGEDWDGGWGAEEAALEEKHYQKNAASQPISLFTPIEQTNLKLKESEERIAELEQERDRLEEQKQELQLKSNKLMKKLKEYKVKLDEVNSTQSFFRKSSSIESSNDLDLAIQEELRSQVKQLEEKLDELKKNTEKDTSERNHLLKRVDVLTAANDRMTEMKECQDSNINLYKSRIRELDEKLKNLEDWGGDDHEENTQKEVKPNANAESTESSSVISQQELNNKIANLSAELNDLKIDREELQALLDEERTNVTRSESKINLLQERISLFEDDQKNESNLYQSEFNNIQIENQNLKVKLNEFEINIERTAGELRSVKLTLDSVSRDLEKKCEEYINIEKQNQDLLTRNQQLTIEMEKLKLDSLKNERIDHLEELLREKSSEILHLNQKVEDLQHEDQTEKLVLEILAKNQEIHMLKIEVRNLTEERSDLENNLSLQLTRAMSNRHDEKQNDDSQKRIDELERIIEEMRAEKMQMEEELKVLNNHVLSTLEAEDKTNQAIFELDVKKLEIAELKKSLEMAKEQSVVGMPGSIENVDLTQVHAQWEAVVEQKCNEIAESWRAHLEQKEFEHNEIEKSLRQKLENIEKPQREPNESTNLEIDSSESDSKTESKDISDMELVQKMQSALENQEMEIVTLKEQLAIRSAEYAQIAAQYDPYQMKKSFAASSLDGNTQKRSASTGDSTVVPKTELDSVLYMLHQSDMLCEELKFELVHLLEERDTLQLKLSNTIRQLEDIKRKIGWKEAEHETSQLPSGGTNYPFNPSPLGSDEADSKKNADALNVKISQIQSVSHLKDKNYQEERELRIHQMAKNPSQAIENLVGTDMSQSEQTPSSALLNWFWGKPNTNPQQS